MGPVSRPQRKHDNNESVITIDIPKEQNQDAKGELEEFKKMIADPKPAQKDTSMEDKEKHKQEKMALALMMAKFDAVSVRVLCLCGPAAVAPPSDLRSCASSSGTIQQDTFSDKDEQPRQILAMLDAIDSYRSVSTLTHEDIVSVRRC